ncbi:uncharacterized protein G2W53_027558 [Senna tora]|uniref:Uncharacterized protein n=1 Tax=Senna tora TaxID=362788 RepID=A0A834TH50_9FABA|nr:uncharacterized protein G2W53_027558 [Senna tora]
MNEKKADKGGGESGKPSIIGNLSNDPLDIREDILLLRPFLLLLQPYFFLEEFNVCPPTQPLGVTAHAPVQ